MTNQNTCSRCGVPLTHSEILDLEGVCRYCFSSQLGVQNNQIASEIKEEVDLVARDAKSWLLQNVSKESLLTFINLFPDFFGVTIDNCPSKMKSPYVTFCIKKHLYSTNEKCLVCKPVKDYIVKLAVTYNLHYNEEPHDPDNEKHVLNFIERKCSAFCNFELKGDCDLQDIHKQAKECMELHNKYGETLWNVTYLLAESISAINIHYVDTEYIEEAIIYYIARKKVRTEEKQIEKIKPSLSFYRRVG